ncbi:TIGR00341 family protein [Amphiplicatus metriothermophilus]|uniref:TIGR00341 family protein n=1 Tax=Amphiplicatus metriothermophilus TaxID=1519374 RepID=A0A239PLI0_9PROT|nr:TIGR00341 family protein [Amphiplicatus metriothermophilus]MBB5517254.1 putative hydrophobic protein (TIGR00341 family) [Amphiplicatus metriothermophilus]SNT68410.1 TIGR00341 family protein [Amphiplicatus metriothermophilus]
MRLIEATFSEKCAERVREAIEEAEPVYWRLFEADDEGRRLLKAFFGKSDIQGFVDRLQSICEADEGWRILVLPVEATAPALDEEKEEDRERRRRVALREEIYEDVAGGAALSADFFILTLASAIVAAIGLNADNIPAVIGAMVIAPLLGPILAFSFGSALGDFKLILRSARNAVIGLSTGLLAAAAISFVMPINLESRELMSRTVVGLDSIALALAAGAAAALSIATGVSSALVGVMVAVALLPPAAAVGLFLGAGEAVLAGRALLLLMVNVTCIMLAAQAVYAYKGVRPRKWFEQKSAQNAVRVNFVVLIAMLAAAAAIIVFSPTEVLPDLSLRD